MGFNVSKALKEITTNKNKIEKEAKQLGRGLGSGADPAKALEAFKKNNKGNPTVLKFMEGLDSEIQNNPTAIQVAKAIDSRLDKYVPLENDPMRIVTNSGIKTIIPKDLPPEAVKAITKLYGEPKFWNSNKGVSIGDVNNIYDPNIADTLVTNYNNAIKNPEVLELLEGKPFNRDLAGKIAYNIIASGLWGSTGSDAAQVANRFSGNPDDIWNPNAVGLAAALTRGAVPLIKPIAKLFGNAKALSMVTDLGVPFVGAKVLKHATTPSTDQDATNATDATNTDALKDIKFKNNWN
jgi:hypothetical protein